MTQRTKKQIEIVREGRKDGGKYREAGRKGKTQREAIRERNIV